MNRGTLTLCALGALCLALAAPAVARAPVPALTGQAIRYQVLAARWQATGTSFQWLRCDKRGGHCSEIAGATRQSYQVTQADLGHTLRVSVVSVASSSSAAALSKASAVVTKGSARAIVGSMLSDLIAGTASSNLLFGGEGDDTISGGAAGDALFGDDGNDTLDGGPGRDFLSGAFGDDTFRAVDGEADVIDCGFGLDTVYADAIDMVSPGCEHVIRS
jgi:hypothetical protein